MAGMGPGPAVPVWLAEDDLGRIVCHGLLAWPAALPCGHSFSWDACRAWGRGGRGVAARLQLRKNTLLQALADKYGRAVPQPGTGPGPDYGSDSDSAPGAQATPQAPRGAAPLPVGGGSAARSGPPAPPAPLYPQVVVQKSLTEVCWDLAELRHLPEPGPDSEVSMEGGGREEGSEGRGKDVPGAFSGGVDCSLASPKLEASNIPERRRMRDILHDLEEIEEKLWENFTWKEALEQREDELSPTFLFTPTARPEPPAPKKASWFDQCKYAVRFGVSLACCGEEL
ncbi:hypothetical protein MC885_020457 [Smutsia gigantea]|nr:hypothetical protein MC885_020457 [Smutsia gigantea]